MAGTPTNPYYYRQNDYEILTTARGSDIVNETDSIQTGFDVVDAEITKLEGDVANLELGSPPGFPAPIDTRWYVTDTSGGANKLYTGLVSPPATGAENVPDGYTITFLPIASCIAEPSLNVGTADGAIPIVKFVAGTNVPAEAGDLSAGVPVNLMFLGGSWVIRGAPGTSSGGVPVGTILSYAGSSAPAGYLLCDGSDVAKAVYGDLWLTIGTTYGVAGNPTDDFKLPDLRNRVPAGSSGTHALGSSTGTETHTLTSAEMPAHSHTTGSAGSHSHTTGSAGDHRHALLTDIFSGSSISGACVAFDSPVTTRGYTSVWNSMYLTDFVGSHTHTISTASSHTHSVTTAGADAAHNNMQPTLYINHVIKY